jgi:hypothetical protein
MTLKPSSLGSTANNYIGKSQWVDPYLNGSVDEFRIYGVALSPPEISACYALGPGQLLSADSPVVIPSLSGPNLMMVWPLASAGFSLQLSTNLTQGTWVNVTSPGPQIVGSQWQMTVPPPTNSDSVYFRLVK